MADTAAGTLIPGVTRLALGGAELPGATLWAQADYVADAGYLTVTFGSQGPRWQPGTTAVLAITRSGGSVQEVPVRIEEEVWRGEPDRMARLRLRIVGSEPWVHAEELLAGDPDA